MREAIGSTWLTGIIITFIAIFSGFLAYSISYTKAFKVKNTVLSIIENKEGFYTSPYDLRNISESALKDDTTTEAEIFKYIKSLGYNYTMFDNKSNPCKEGELMEGGYCLIKYCPENGGVYYKVTSYISLSLPIINLGINIPVTGETKSMYYDNSPYECVKN